MEHSQQIRTPDEVNNKNRMSVEDEIIDRVNSLVESGDDMEPGHVEILLAIKDIITEASYFQMFPSIHERFFLDILQHLTPYSALNLSILLSELAMELCRKGILESGEKLMILSLKMLEDSGKKPSPSTLLRLLDNLFNVGFYTAKEKWFTEALAMYKSFKKDIDEPVYQEQVLTKFSKWVQISELSEWKNTLHRLNFEVMMMKFSLGEI